MIIEQLREMNKAKKEQELSIITGKDQIELSSLVDNGEQNENYNKETKRKTKLDEDEDNEKIFGYEKLSENENNISVKFKSRENYEENYSYHHPTEEGNIKKIDFNKNRNCSYDNENEIYYDYDKKEYHQHSSNDLSSPSPSPIFSSFSYTSSFYSPPLYSSLSTSGYSSLK
jgi:hypothetical protein